MLSPVLKLLGSEDGHLRSQGMASALGITLGELAALLRVNKNSLSGDGQGAIAQKRMSEVARILVRAAAIMDNGDGGEAGRAILWFRNQPLPEFRNQTAMELVRVYHGPAVIAHLDKLEKGGHA